jgi:hypothetical protein
MVKLYFYSLTQINIRTNQAFIMSSLINHDDVLYRRYATPQLVTLLKTTTDPSIEWKTTHAQIAYTNCCKSSSPHLKLVFEDIHKAIRNEIPIYIGQTGQNRYQSRKYDNYGRT